MKNSVLFLCFYFDVSVHALKHHSVTAAPNAGFINPEQIHIKSILDNRTT